MCQALPLLGTGAATVKRTEHQRRPLPHPEGLKMAQVGRRALLNQNGKQGHTVRFAVAYEWKGDDAIHSCPQGVMNGPLWQQAKKKVQVCPSEEAMFGQLLLRVSLLSCTGKGNFEGLKGH